MKIALATRDNPLGRYFVNKLCSLTTIDLVLIEKPKFKWKFVQKKIKQIGLFSTIYAGYRNWLTKRRAKKFLGYSDFKTKTHKVSSLNADFSRFLLRSYAIDLLVIFGTSILGKRILKIPSAGVINLHTGFLPHYRGVKSEFWALLNDEPHYVGSGIHFVDAGIDTGAVLFDSCPARIYKSLDEAHFRNFVTGVHSMGILLENFEVYKKGAKVQAGGQYYSTPRIKDWIKFYWKRKLKHP